MKHRETKKVVAAFALVASAALAWGRTIHPPESASAATHPEWIDVDEALPRWPGEGALEAVETLPPSDPSAPTERDATVSPPPETFAWTLSDSVRVADTAEYLEAMALRLADDGGLLPAGSMAVAAADRKRLMSALGIARAGSDGEEEDSLPSSATRGEGSVLEPFSVSAVCDRPCSPAWLVSTLLKALPEMEGVSIGPDPEAPPRTVFLLARSGTAAADAGVDLDALVHVSMLATEGDGR